MQPLRWFAPILAVMGIEMGNNLGRNLEGVGSKSASAPHTSIGDTGQAKIQQSVSTSKVPPEDRTGQDKTGHGAGAGPLCLACLFIRLVNLHSLPSKLGQFS